MPSNLRVALFCDSYHELNGVATVSREFTAYAQRSGTPLCCVRAGPATKANEQGPSTTLELKRAFTFALDADLFCDPFLSRHRRFVLERMREFRPDLIHITGPGDLGTLGFWISNTLGVPMAASWHTNLHEYAGKRAQKALHPYFNGFSERAAGHVEALSLKALTAFYRLAHFTVAPNEDMVELLGERTGRPAYLMRHGVDTSRFQPGERARGGPFRIGWVGRLTPEKNVRALAELERRLIAEGERNFELVVVGDGSEREWLRANLRFASMPGFLEGGDLVEAFASMDAFVFPSETDTFGLVVLEALASGVPVVLSAAAGRRVGMRDGIEGIFASDLGDGVLQLMRCAGTRETMSGAAARFAKGLSWDAVFDDLYGTYGEALRHPEVRRRIRGAE